MSRRGVPWGLVGMLAMVAAVEWAIARVGPDVADVPANDWARTGRAASKRVKDCDLLCFGDSMAKLAVAPRIVEARSGRRAYNLAVVGGQAPSAYYLLRRALDAGANPSAVVVDYMPPLLAEPCAYNLDRWPWLLDVGEAIDLALTAREPDLFARLALGRLFPTIRARLDLRAIVLAALRGEASTRREVARVHRRNWDHNRGAMILACYENRTDPAVWYGANFDGPWRADPVNAEYVHRFLGLAESRGVFVYWLLPPIDGPTQALCERGGQDGRIEAFVRECAAMHRNVTVLDARHSNYDRSALVDAVHLNHRGARALSADLADLVRKGPRMAARWVALPNYRERPDDGTIEDLERSRVAASAPIATRR